MECMPDIYGNYIVWEDRNNGTLAADIVLYNIANKEKSTLPRMIITKAIQRFSKILSYGWTRETEFLQMIFL